MKALIVARDFLEAQVAEQRAVVSTDILGTVIGAVERTTEMREVTYCVALPIAAADDGCARASARTRQ